MLLRTIPRISSFFQFLYVLYPKAYQFQVWSDLHAVYGGMVAKWILNLPSRLPEGMAGPQIECAVGPGFVSCPFRGLCCWCLSVLQLSNAFWFCTLLRNRSRTHSHMASCWLKLFGKSGVGLCQLNRGFGPNCHPGPPPSCRSLIQVCQGTCLKIALAAGERIPQLMFPDPHTFLKDLTLKPHDEVKILNPSLQCSTLGPYWNR